MKRLLLALLMTCAAMLGDAEVALVSDGTTRVTRQNVIVIVSDDQRADTLAWMPTLQRLEARTFDAAYVTTPLCCPSRASLLTGQYAHTHGVRTNDPPLGGFAVFKDGDTLATRMQAAGYRTALMGKYLNGYQDTYIPPGWDTWFAFYGGVNYYNFRINDGGTVRRYPQAEGVYSTDLLFDHAEQFLRDSQGTPFFLYLTPFTPHGPATPAPRHADLYADLAPWRPPSFNEADVSDKPAWLQEQPLMSAEQIASQDAYRLRQLRSLAALDEGLQRLLTVLDQTGLRQSTTLIFIGDNGILWGEHRIADEKACAYHECVQVPLVISHPTLTRSPSHTDAIALNIDIAPTVLDLARVPIPSSMEGKSLVPLLRGHKTLRSDFLVESWNPGNGVESPDFFGVQSRNWRYTEYGTGDVELYDLKHDPYELNNLASDPKFAKERAKLAKRLQHLRK